MFLRRLIADVPGSMWARGASGACIVLICVLSLLPQDLRVSTGLPGYFEHAAAYLGTGFILGLTLRGKTGPMVAGFVLAGLGPLMEVMQYWSPGRHPRLGDAIVSGGAGIVGAGVAALLRTLSVAEASGETVPTSHPGCFPPRELP